MKHFRSQLTRLKALITEKLPDSSDVFGFPGVSKTQIIAAVGLIYDLSKEIEDRDDGSQFEIIALKRFGSRVYEQFKFLEGLNNGPIDNPRFDHFLTLLSEFLEKTKMVYLVVNHAALRDDAELQSIREKTACISESLTALVSLHADYSEKASEASTCLTSITEAASESDRLKVEIVDWHNQSLERSSEIENLYSKVTGWEEDLALRNAEIRAAHDQIAILQKESRDLKLSLEGSVKSGEISTAILKKLETENQSLQTEIKQTLGDANRQGMAASFKERKKEVEYSLWWWRVTFSVALPTIALVAWKLLDEVNSPTSNWISILARIGVISPLVWLGWFSARQYSHLSRIAEDYAFKYAAAMAYEGFKKATRETSAELESALLEFSLFNMAQNPIRLLQVEQDHASPANEMFDRLMKSLKHMRMVTIEHPAVGKFVAETHSPSSKP